MLKLSSVAKSTTAVSGLEVVSQDVEGGRKPKGPGKFCADCGRYHPTGQHTRTQPNALLEVGKNAAKPPCGKCGRTDYVDIRGRLCDRCAFPGKSGKIRKLAEIAKLKTFNPGQGTAGGSAARARMRRTQSGPIEADPPPKGVRLEDIAHEWIPHGRLVPEHEVRDRDKVEAIARDLREHGWRGRPLLGIKWVEGANSWIALITGVHRRAAAEAAELPSVPVHVIYPQTLDFSDHDLAHQLPSLGKNEQIAALKRMGLPVAAKLIEEERRQTVADPNAKLRKLADVATGTNSTGYSEAKYGPFKCANCKKYDGNCWDPKVVKDIGGKPGHPTVVIKGETGVKTAPTDCCNEFLSRDDRKAVRKLADVVLAKGPDIFNEGGAFHGAFAHLGKPADDAPTKADNGGAAPAGYAAPSNRKPGTGSATTHLRVAQHASVIGQQVAAYRKVLRPKTAPEQMNQRLALNTIHQQAAGASKAAKLGMAMSGGRTSFKAKASRIHEKAHEDIAAHAALMHEHAMAAFHALNKAPGAITADDRNLAANRYAMADASARHIMRRAVEAQYAAGLKKGLADGETGSDDLRAGKGGGMGAIKQASDVLSKHGPGHRFSEHEDDIADHIIEGEVKRGKSREEAKRIAYATINSRRRGMRKAADLNVPLANDLYDDAVALLEIGKAKDALGHGSNARGARSFFSRVGRQYVLDAPSKKHDGARGLFDSNGNHVGTVHHRNEGGNKATVYGFHHPSGKQFTRSLDTSGVPHGNPYLSRIAQAHVDVASDIANHHDSAGGGRSGQVARGSAGARVASEVGYTRPEHVVANQRFRGLKKLADVVAKAKDAKGHGSDARGGRKNPFVVEDEYGGTHRYRVTPQGIVSTHEDTRGRKRTLEHPGETDPQKVHESVMPDVHLAERIWQRGLKKLSDSLADSDWRATLEADIVKAADAKGEGTKLGRPPARTGGSKPGSVVHRTQTGYDVVASGREHPIPGGQHFEVHPTGKKQKVGEIYANPIGRAGETGIHLQPVAISHDGVNLGEHDGFDAAVQAIATHYETAEGAKRAQAEGKAAAGAKDALHGRVRSALGGTSPKAAGDPKSGAKSGSKKAMKKLADIAKGEGNADA